MKKVVLLGMAAVLLAGCNQLPFFKVTSPQRKAGLWEQSEVRDNNPPVVTQWCFDATSDRATPALGRGPRQAAACEKYQVSQNGTTYTTDSVCAPRGPDGIKLTTHSVMSGDYNARYTIESTVTVENAPIPGANGAHKRVMTAVYKGDCPSDMTPGQLRCPNGNVIDMASLRTPGGGGGCGRGGGMGGGMGGGGNATNSAANSAPASNAPASGGQ